MWVFSKWMQCLKRKGLILKIRGHLECKPIVSTQDSISWFDFLNIHFSSHSLFTGNYFAFPFSSFQFEGTGIQTLSWLLISIQNSYIILLLKWFFFFHFAMDLISVLVIQWLFASDFRPIFYLLFIRIIRFEDQI